MVAVAAGEVVAVGEEDERSFQTAVKGEGSVEGTEEEVE